MSENRGNSGNNDNQGGTGPSGRGNRGSGLGGPGPVRVSRGALGWLVFIGMVLLLFALLHYNQQPTEEIGITQFYTYLDNGQIEQIVIKDQSITGRFRPMAGRAENAEPNFKVDYPPSAIDSQFVEDLAKRGKAHGTQVKYKGNDSIFLKVLVSMLPWVVIIGLFWFLVLRQMRQATGGAGMLGSFGRSRHRVLTKEHTNVTFADVAGIDEAKEEVTELIEFLRNPKKFQRLGGRIPRGVLLVGEPGCGKTLLAKAIAGEADVPFFSISGSDFVEMFVGVGASRVRDLFTQAKSSAPCIVFLDEIDAVGRRRGAGFNGGGHDEREQTLNAILVEMDGFDSSDQVIVISATNRPDVLDPALTRPGRFDRQVYVPLPDIKGRYEILKVHSRKVKLGPDADLHKLARGTPMFSGADLEAIINEAAIAATMQNKQYVEMADLEEARDKVRWGRAKKSRVIDEQEKRIIAYHEAGHALVSQLLPDADPLHKVSIIPRAQAGGMTMMLPEKDRHLYSKRFALANLRVMLGGRGAEAVACDDISSGASDDIKRATQLARMMICDWGMSEQLGPIRFAGEEPARPWVVDLSSREYSEKTAEIIDREIKQLVDDALHHVKRLLSDNRDKLGALAEALLKYETLEAEDVQRILNGRPLDKPTVSDLLDAEKQAADQKAEEPSEKPAGEQSLRPEPGPQPRPGFA